MKTLRQRVLRRDGQAGLSLVEMLVAIFILMIAMTAMAGSLITALTGDTKTALRETGIQLAMDRLEQLRRAPFASVRPESTVVPAPVTALGSGATINSKGTTYTISDTRIWCADAWNGQGGAADLDYLKLTVTVNWSVKGRAQAVQVGGYRTPVRGDRGEDEFVGSTTPQGSGSCA